MVPGAPLLSRLLLQAVEFLHQLRTQLGIEHAGVLCACATVFVV